VQYLVDALSYVKFAGVHGSRNDLLLHTLCEPTFELEGTNYKFCPQKCYDRSCDKCGVEKWKQRLETDNEELLQSPKVIRWLTWKTTGVDADGKATAVPQLIWECGTISKCFSTLCEKLETYASHHFNSEWHRLQFSQSTKNVTDGTVMEVYDFSQNLTLRMANEIQSAYWDATSVGIHGVVAYYQCPTEGCESIVTHEFVQLSNEREKDSFMPRLASDIVLQKLLETGVKIERRVQFSDNCLSQYKSQRPFVHLSQSAVPTMKMFFGEKHGKSPCDAMFSKLKRIIGRIIFKENTKLNKNPFIVKNSQDVYQICKLKLECERDETDHYAMTFNHIGGQQLRRNLDPTVKTVDGTKKFHSVMNTGNRLEVKSRKTGCVCTKCVHGEFELCMNKEIVDTWQLHKLVPTKKTRYIYDVKSLPDCSKELSVENFNLLFSCFNCVVLCCSVCAQRRIVLCVKIYNFVFSYISFIS
jgi:hypothetical protein